jgi:hypothetical protein
MRITLCGSTRFEEQFKEWNHKLAIAGHTVYSLSLFAREATDVGKEGKHIITEAEKITLDLVHLDKIINSEAIVVIDVDGYVGFSTKREIEWARMQHKKVYWITPDLGKTNPNWYRFMDNSDTWAGCLL